MLLCADIYVLTFIYRHKRHTYYTISSKSVKCFSRRFSMKETKDWNFITNHGLMLLYIWQHPQCTARDMAPVIKATERTVYRVLADLEREGYIAWQRTGKGNIYEISRRHGLKHELTRDLAVGELLDLLSLKRKCRRRMDSSSRHLKG
jgi:predicted HTH transcriptional regulator